MTKAGIFKSAGVFIILLTALINRFVCAIPDIIYTPLIVISIVLIIIGFYKDKDDKKIIF